MATIRLVPNTIYNAAGTSYIQITNASNAYTNTDSTTYATIYNSNASTSNRYIYVRGFNFDDVPANAVVTSFTIKMKGYESGISTSTSYQPYLANGTTAINGSCSPFSTSVTTRTFSGISATWDTIKGYGANFGIRINCRRNSRNTAGYVYLYGAEIEVTYTVPNPRTVTTTLNGNGVIDPSGTQIYYDDDVYDLLVTSTNAADTVTATKNGTAITLTQHTGGTTSDSAVLGEYHLVSGGFNGSGATYFQGLVGKGHTNTTTSSNYYSSGSGTQAVFQYDIEFNDVPTNATITGLYMMANGHAESTSNANEYMCVQLKSGSTNLSAQYNFKNAGTSNTTQTINATTLPTHAQLENLVVECTLGYYGGAINGVTVFLEYEVSGVWYTYSTTISGDMTIVVTIGSVVSQPKIFLKNNSWIQYSKIYVKINGSWVEQNSSTWSTLFDTSKNYRLIT